MFLLALVLVLLLTASTAKAQNLQGSFSGKLNAGMAKLTIVLNIETDGTATLESPDQTDQKIPATVDFLSADSVAVSIAALSRPKFPFSGVRTRQYTTIHSTANKTSFSS